MSRPRIRTIKPDTWADEKIGMLSRDARLLFVTLITLADDEGRLRLLPAAILGHGFPYDQDAPALFDRWLEEVLASGLVRRYVVAAQRYLELPGFARHQVINRPRPSELPASGGVSLPPTPDGTPPVPVTDQSVNGQGQVSARREGKGKERNPPPNPPRTSSEGEPDIPANPSRETAKPGSRRQRAANPRARGANPRAIAAQADREQATAAARSLGPPGTEDRERWQRIRAALKAAVPESTYVWVEPLELVAAEPDGLVLDAPPEIRSLFKTRFAQLLRTCAEHAGAHARLATEAEHDGLTAA